jgi:DNA invertase Pin-like site-specific DNA recombinase
MRVAIYCRVSTDLQTNETQESQLRDYCKMKGWSDIEVFIDDGVSGTRRSRPELDHMLSRVRNKEFDAVMVWRFDRASRSTKQLLELLEEFQKLGVDFISLREQIDTSTPAGKLMFTMVSGFAQFERDLISERTKAAMQEAKKRGVKYGRDKKYDHSKVIQMKKEGFNINQISEQLGISGCQARKIIREAA